MKENGHDERLALTRIDQPLTDLLQLDPEVSRPGTADLAALYSDWLGLKDIAADPTFTKTLKKLPVPGEKEHPADYIMRIWHDDYLGLDERGTILDLGLAKMVTMGRVSNVGVQLRVWRALVSGDWRGSPSGHNSFRKWVRDTITDSLDGSGTEASLLATVCEAVMWLSNNPLDGVEIPEDLEACFRRPLYRRWRSLAGKILKRIQALEEEENGADIEEEIAEMVEAIYDEKKTTEDLDGMGKQKTKLPPVVVIEAPNRDDLGRVLCAMALTEAQAQFLRQKMGKSLKWTLAGESADDWTLVEYRSQEQWVCAVCGYIFSTERSYCAHCDKQNVVQHRIAWATRSYTEDAGWSSWYRLSGEPEFSGSYAGKLEDPEAGVTYFRYYEEVT